jgi:hypothetical protein
MSHLISSKPSTAASIRMRASDTSARKPVTSIGFSNVEHWGEASAYIE